MLSDALESVRLISGLELSTKLTPKKSESPTIRYISLEGPTVVLTISVAVWFSCRHIQGAIGGSRVVSIHHGGGSRVLAAGVENTAEQKMNNRVAGLQRKQGVGHWQADGGLLDVLAHFIRKIVDDGCHEAAMSR